MLDWESKMQTNDPSNSHDRFEASVNLFVDPTEKAHVIDALSKDLKTSMRFMRLKENLTLFL